MQAVEVVIPWRSGCEHRTRALRWVGNRYAAVHPGWRVTVSEVVDGRPWVKAAAAMPAIAGSTAEIVIVADADVWCDELADAVEVVASGEHRWAVPHERVIRLARGASLDVTAGGVNPADLPWSVVERPYVGLAGGGLVVLERSTALDVPLDPRFEGWGGEDHAWGVALGTLAGPMWRGTAPLWHLWHPPQPRRSRKLGSKTNEALRRRYRDADGMPVAMAEIVREAKRWH